MSSCIAQALPGTITGEFSPSGLKVAGRMIQVTVPDNAWVALPTTALSGRNAVSVQNQSAFEMKVNYDNSVGYIGANVAPNGERFWDVTDAITLYGRAFPGAGPIVILVEEIS
jgi:hypothetical protein